MGPNTRIGAGAFALLATLLLFHTASQAQDAPPPDAVVSPSPGQAPVRGVDLSGLATATLRSERQYPVSSAPLVSISHEFGDVRVQSWDNPVVQIVTNIRVGAQDATLAQRIAQSIDIDVKQHDNAVEAQTIYPIMGDSGREDGYEVHYDVLVPRDAELIIKNLLGETMVKGVDGPITIDAKFGVVELLDIGGRVTVHASGEFPVNVDGLRRGGVFDLKGSHAVFSNSSGLLKVNNFLGRVEIHHPGDSVDMDVRCESGPIELYLPPGTYPDLDLRADFGFIDSRVNLDSVTVRNSMRGRHVNTDATQHLTLSTTFDSIRIHQLNTEVESELSYNGPTEPLIKPVTEQYPVADGATVQVDAIVGDVTIEGADVNDVIVTATQFVRARTAADARAALESLVLDVDATERRVYVRTYAINDLEVLGVSEYKVDLDIRVPRASPVQVNADRGLTRVLNTGGAIVARQRAGQIQVEHAKGELDLQNDQGDILALDCAGPVSAHGVSGTLTMRNIYGDIDVAVEDGKTIIDTIGGAVVAESLRGDVKIIAVKGVSGDYHLRATDGNISMVLSDSVDAKLFLTAKEGGRVLSAIEVSGKQSRDMWNFQTVVNSGSYLVEVETVRGDIVID